MRPDRATAAPAVEELLTLLREALPQDLQSQFRERETTVRLLLAGTDEFSAEGFVAAEVTRALDL